MRIVQHDGEFFEMLESSKAEAMKSFGDDRVLVEKYITKPRHVEVQVFADNYGEAVYLWERDCSVQRRHQKIIEEAPAPHLDESLRHLLGSTAVAAAKAVKYRGAGTVEFILNADQPKEFYFMEMNTRLQVEHPVSEMITQQDFVEWQFLIAAGNPLPLKQEEIPQVGHAFEARIYAEKPELNFLPDAGKLVFLRTPQEQSWLRVETGIRQGDSVSIYYDPMIAKLVVHGSNREHALRRLVIALEQYRLIGPSTNVSFLKRLAEHPSFVKGQVHTGFIPNHYDALFPKEIREAIYEPLAALAISIVLPKTRPWDPWDTITNFQNDFIGAFIVKENTYEVRVKKLSHDSFQVQCQERLLECKVYSRSDSTENISELSVVFQNSKKKDFMIVTNKIRGLATEYTLFEQRKGDAVVIQKKEFLASVRSRTREANLKEGLQVKSPMFAKISSILVKEGQKVIENEALLVIEAMKMEHSLRSPKVGIVRFVSNNLNVGEMIQEGTPILTIE